MNYSDVGDFNCDNYVYSRNDEDDYNDDSNNNRAYNDGDKNHISKKKQKDKKCESERKS